MVMEVDTSAPVRILEKLKSGRFSAGVIGLGYVGLPLAVELAKAGRQTVGIDVNRSCVEGILAGRSHISDVSSDDLARLLGEGTLSATSDFSVCRELDVIVICVPTPLTATKDPDLSYVESAARSIEPFLRGDQLVVLESTTYPGTTEEVVLPILEAGDKKLGRDFYLAFSPERVDPGNTRHTISNTPKVLGGVTPDSTEAAKAFYQGIVNQVVPLSSAKAAELTKLLENIFRCVNIALVNELMLLCHRMGIDVWEVIRAASTKPFGFMPFYPGPGLGGHCIPVDPFYLNWKAREYGFHTEFIELAGQTNEYMPHYVVERITEALNEHSKAAKGSTLLILGVAYKKDVGDTRESPALKVMELLQARGADIKVHDPFVPEVKIDGKAYRSEPLSADLLASSDCAVILADHSNVDYDLVVSSAPLVVDSRNALRAYTSDNIRRL